MNADDNDNIYVLEDEEINDVDDTPRNYASYDDEEIDEEKEEGNIIKGISPFSLLMSIMFNPVEGWKKLRRSKKTLQELQSGCFYPLLALLALSKFADFIYSVNVTITQIVTQAVVAFVSYFFGFFCIQMVLSWILPKDMALKFEEEFGKEYTVMALSTLVLFSIVINVLPMIWPILIFLPIWTLYIMFKGVKFFKFQQNQEMKFFVLSGATTIGMPILIDWIINGLLPY